MPAMMASAFAAETRLTLASLLVAGGNERKAVEKLVELVSLKGALVTADAMHCHEDLAKRIVAAKGDYVLRLKSNQPGLLAGAKAAPAGAGVKSAAVASLRNGTNVIRQAAVASVAALAVRTTFPGLKAVADVQQVGAEPEERFYLRSRRIAPECLIQAARSHWAIENSHHRVLDTASAEDHDRSRRNNAPKSRRPATAGPQHRKTVPGQNTHAPETAPCRMGRGLLLDIVKYMQ